MDKATELLVTLKLTEIYRITIGDRKFAELKQIVLKRAKCGGLIEAANKNGLDWQSIEKEQLKREHF